MTHIQIEDNESARLVTDDFKIRNLVAQTLTFKHPSYVFTKAHKEGGWNGDICLFKRHSNSFGVGLIGLVNEKINEIGLRIPIHDLRPKSSIIPSPDGDDISKILIGKTLRDYQVSAIRTIFHETRGIIQSPTGSGKTVIAGGFIKLANMAGKKCLFVTHQKELLHQTYKAFNDVGIDAGICGDSIRDLAHKTIIGTVQTLYAGVEKRNKKGAIVRRANPEILSLLQSIDILILDEAHRGDSDSFQAVCNNCKNAYYRIGLTATPLMKSQLDDLALIKQTGTVIYRITIKDLVERGLLAQPYIKLVKISRPELNRNLKYNSAYSQGIVLNDHRNQQIVDHAVGFAQNKLTTLILVSMINHGKLLLQSLSKYPGLKVRFIHGSKDDETRNEALAALKDKKIDILISTTITDEGVDIPAVSAVILAGGMKSPIKLYQRIGRGMRPKETGNWVLIVDFIDLTNRHLASHSKERFQLIHEEPGFKIVPNFDSLIKMAA